MIPIITALTASALGQCLSITVTNPTDLGEGPSSHCVAASPSDPCVCPVLTANEFGGEAPYEVAQPNQGQGCSAAWQAGQWYTVVQLTEAGGIGLAQYQTTFPPFAGLEACLSTPPGLPGTPLPATGSSGLCAVGLYLGGIFHTFPVLECEMVPDGFVVYCRKVSDIDRSGVINVADLFAYLALWFAGSARADTDADGAVSTPDVFQFITAWFGQE